MIIGIDFDGTCVTHDFPRIGKDIGAVPVLKELVANGHKLILFTMRSDKKDVSTADYEINNQSGKYLSEAVQWFKDNDIPLYGINENPDQHTWTDSSKPYCHIYIDDSSLVCPMTSNRELSDRLFVDWRVIRCLLKLRGLI